jgi:hypothetical protein
MSKIKKSNKIKLMQIAIGLSVNHPKWSTNRNKAIKSNYKQLLSLFNKL